MTHIIISRNVGVQLDSLLELISKTVGRELSIDEVYSNPDIHILKNDNKSIGIEEIKDIQSQMIFKPFVEKVQICVIFNSEKLTTEAQNAFLKTLEDSPDHTVYILLLNDERNVLDTILSRGVKQYPTQEKEIEEETSPDIIGIDLVDQFERIQQLSELETREVLEYIKGIQKYFQRILREDIKNGRDVLRTQKTLDIVNTAYTRISANGNKKLVLENMIVQMSK
jgi:hypothetical protein